MVWQCLSHYFTTNPVLGTKQYNSSSLSSKRDCSPIRKSWYYIFLVQIVVRTCVSLQVSPSGCRWHQIRGVSQVEKGDACKTLAPLILVLMISERTESWATDFRLLITVKSSSLVFDPLACLGVYLVGGMDYLLYCSKESVALRLILIGERFSLWK